MKRASIAVAVLVAFTLTGCSGAAEETPREPQAFAQTATEEAAGPEPSGTPAPLEAVEPNATRDEDAFLTFVRGRLATFPTQIPDATDEQLIAAADVACDRIRGGEPVDRMSVIDGETPSEMGSYFYDSNAIIAGAQMHLCQDTLS